MTQRQARRADSSPRRCAAVAAWWLLAIVSGCAGRSESGGQSSPDSTVTNLVVVGKTVPRLAIAPDGRRLYAATASNLVVIDTTDLSVLQTLDLDALTAAIAVAPDGSRVYITSQASNLLTVYDTAGKQFATPLPLFEQNARTLYSHMAHAPDSQTLYVIDKRNRSLGIVDLPSGAHRRVKSSAWPYDVATSPDGRSVYLVGCRQQCAAGYLQRFDVASQKLTKELEVLGYPVRLVLSPDGQRAYLVNLEGPSVLVVDLAEWQPAGAMRLPWKPHEAAISPDGATLYVTSVEGGWVMAVDTATGTLRSQLSVPFVRDVVVSPNGRQLYVAMASKVVALDARSPSPTP